MRIPKPTTTRRRTLIVFCRPSVEYIVWEQLVHLCTTMELVRPMQDVF